MQAPDEPGRPPARSSSPLAGMRLTELLEEVQDRLGAVARTQAKVQGLLDAFLSVSTGLDLDSTLRRIVDAAAGLVDAEYGALGVLGAGGSLAAFIHVGIDDELAARMGHLPEGKGVLGKLITDPYPLRIADLHEHPASVGFPPHHPEMHSFLGVPVLVRGEVFGNLYMTEKREGDFTAEDEAVLTALAGAAGIAIENAHLYAEGEVRNRWLTAVSDVRSALLGETAPEEALRLITDRVADLTAADAAFLLFGPDPVDGCYELRAQSGADLPDITGTRLACGDRLVLEAVAAAGSVVLVDLTGLPYRGPHDHLAWGPSVAVPIHASDAGNAVLIASRYAGGPPFDTSIAPLFTFFADQTALALDMAARQQAARQLDVYEDRDRIARDLHDHVIQRLFAAGLSLQAVARVTDPDSQGRIGAVVAQLDDTVRDIRTTIFDLHTGGLTADKDSLRRRLLDLVNETAGSDLTATVRMSGAVDSLVTGDLAADVEAVVREGVSNVARHARAANVTVTLDVTGDVVVEVVDNGMGIDERAARSGLRNLAERARRRGGDATAERLPEGGTRLRWYAPLPRNGTEPGSA